MLQHMKSIRDSGIALTMLVFSPCVCTVRGAASNSEQEAASGLPQRGQSKSPVWTESKESRDDTDAQSASENSEAHHH
jgi:hypothetical protein